MNITTVNLLVGIIGTLIGLLISSIELRNHSKKQLKEEAVELAAIQADLKFIKELSEKNSNEICQVKNSLAIANEKIARIDERIKIVRSDN